MSISSLHREDSTTEAADQNRSLTRMLRSLASDLESSGIQYCLLDGREGLIQSNPSELFVAVPLDDITRFEGVLTMSPELRVVQMTSPTAGSFRFVLAYEGEEQTEFFPLTVLIDVRARGHIFFSAGDLLEGARRVDHFQVAAPEVELGWLLVKHCCDGLFPADVVERLFQIAYDDNDGARNSATDIFGEDCGRKVVRRLLASDETGLNALCSEMRDWLYYEVFKLDPMNQFWFWTDELARKWKTWRNPAGFWLAIHGAEATGKTTLMNHVAAQMKQAFSESKQHHLRPQMFSGRRTLEGDVPERGPRLGPFFSMGKLAIFAFDYVIGYWLMIRPALVSSGLVQFKRYFDDLLADPRKHRLGATSWWIRWFRYVIPQPSAHILLEAPADELLARKPNVSKRELERQRDGYHDALDNRAFVVDASQPPEKIARDVVAHILNQMELQYRKRRRKFINTPSTEFKRRLPRYEFIEEPPAEELQDERQDDRLDEMQDYRPRRSRYRTRAA